MPRYDKLSPPDAPNWRNAAHSNILKIWDNYTEFHTNNLNRPLFTYQLSAPSNTPHANDNTSS